MGRTVDRCTHTTSVCGRLTVEVVVVVVAAVVVPRSVCGVMDVGVIMVSISMKDAAIALLGHGGGGVFF